MVMFLSCAYELPSRCHPSVDTQSHTNSHGHTHSFVCVRRDRYYSTQVGIDGFLSIWCSWRRHLIGLLLSCCSYCWRSSWWVSWSTSTPFWRSISSASFTRKRWTVAATTSATACLRWVLHETFSLRAFVFCASPGHPQYHTFAELQGTTMLRGPAARFSLGMLAFPNTSVQHCDFLVS